jgi:hypothetical protein
LKERDENSPMIEIADVSSMPSPLVMLQALLDCARVCVPNGLGTDQSVTLEGFGFRVMLSGCAQKDVRLEFTGLTPTEQALISGRVAALSRTS